MNLRHLNAFVVLAETLHFGEAARKLHISQPPLSRQIAALEETLQVQLFRRRTRTVELTPAGEVFLVSARRILDEVDQSIHRVRAADRGEVGEITIGFTMCAAWSVVPKLLARFKQQRPDVRINLKEVLPSDLDDALLSGELDAGISFPPFNPHQLIDGLRCTTIHSESMVAVMPSKHPCAVKRLASNDVTPLDLALLADDDFVTFPSETAPELHRALMESCRAGGFEPRVVLQTQLQQTIVNLVAEGLGVSLVPESMCRMQLDGVLFVPVLQADVAVVEQAVFWCSTNDNPCLGPFLADNEAGQHLTPDS
ncbi:LysR family transcriptional regulator [Oceanobacter kriegii]|uniref:LysR family transcriptional regulator n=1 Tax=Oceanobacter kriegii TaxID=64972 RepID=UPI0004115C7E|nr:LysR substrate-binding domain-containing protein [Oceanobacter kriegii]